MCMWKRDLKIEKGNKMEMTRRTGGKERKTKNGGGLHQEFFPKDI